jgi:hypothetical protein
MSAAHGTMCGSPFISCFKGEGILKKTDMYFWGGGAGCDSAEIGKVADASLNQASS